MSCFFCGQDAGIAFMFETALINNLFFLFTAFFTALLLVPLARRLAFRFHFFDKPGGRKQHERAVPPVGGLVIFPAFMVLAALFGLNSSLNWQIYGWFYTGLTLLLVTGFFDDRFTVKAWLKFFLQLLAAFLIVVPGQATIYGLGNVFGFGDFWLGFIGIPFSVLAVMLLINGMNLMDGLDGLAGGTGFVVILWLAIAAILAGSFAYAGILLILLGSLGGFLFYNIRHPLRARADIFLGDAGSLALGLSLAWFSLHSALPESHRVLEPMAVAWILALPIFDTCGQFTRRILQGRHPFDPDQHHFHHHFIYAGIPVVRSTPIILLISFVFGGVGVIGSSFGVPTAILSYSWIALLLFHIYMSLRPHRFRRVISRVRGCFAKGS